MSHNSILTHYLSPFLVLLAHENRSLYNTCHETSNEGFDGKYEVISKSGDDIGS